MAAFSIFIDESGSADLKTYKRSPYFTVCGFVINEDHRAKLKIEFEQLKLKHFKKKTYVIHSAELKRELDDDSTKIAAFAKELQKTLNKYQFFLLLTVVDKQKAMKWSWQNSTVYRKSYRTIISNLVKFLIAKHAMGSISAEASTVQQDIHIYESMFHFLSNGIPSLKISPIEVKNRLTSVSFVTKIRNDCEQQIADLLSYYGRLKLEILTDKRTETSLDELDKTLISVVEKHLFKIGKPKVARKKALYNSINSFELLP